MKKEYFILQVLTQEGSQGLASFLQIFPCRSRGMIDERARGISSLDSPSPTMSPQ